VSASLVIDTSTSRTIVALVKDAQIVWQGIIGICSLDAIVVDQAAYTVAIDARRKEIYWARYQDGKRVEGPAVNFPADVAGYIIDLYPDVLRLVQLSQSQNVSEPFYLRRPDAVATADRPS